ncbi:MAG: hypothetical protein GQ574_06410 [Crocinitomix sp.]|nr:hypothetical protein [Crocinitomix sp.]
MKRKATFKLLMLLVCIIVIAPLAGRATNTPDSTYQAFVNKMNAIFENVDLSLVALVLFSAM